MDWYALAVGILIGFVLSGALCYHSFKLYLKNRKKYGD